MIRKGQFKAGHLRPVPGWRGLEYENEWLQDHIIRTKAKMRSPAPKAKDVPSRISRKGFLVRRTDLDNEHKAMRMFDR